MQKKQINRIMRHRKIRTKVRGTAKVPRFCVFRSNRHIYIQLIDDAKGKVLFQAKDTDVKKTKENKTALSYQAGELIADLAKKGGIKKVIFDRGGFKYHGRVKATADGAKAQGLVI
ncbi:50S ribosomal protein L18 [Candidatus Gribaldobacteria bacterium]|nr:50S ribosomal protein L18 [Candidatus Gribaldobacteria bacterium]